ncbi:MAG: hypothetical protein HKO77_03420 [Gemmatimonadetes bacterium]|nr:hypothetical protein [Gemmatimonadota bacterium]NNM35022.1 hypothetical protein [Gemmatimonadota bacterium]
MQSASKSPIEGQDALTVLDGIEDLYVAKGKKINHLNLTDDRPSDDDLLALLLGRSGKLRAPTIRKGNTLVVGYNGDILADTLL